MDHMLQLAIVLTLTFVGGTIGSFFRLPRITGYILTGLIIGPAGTGLLTKEDISNFHFLSEIALGIIAFYIGAEFETFKFKKIKSTVPYLSASEIIVTSVLVFLALLITLPHSPAKASLLGILSIATAPAATLLVIREVDSEGPITNHIRAMVGINNLLCIIVFVITLATIIHMRRGDVGISVLAEISHGLLMPVVIGGCAGLFLYYCLRRNLEENELLVASLTAILLGIGISHYFCVSVLLTNLVMGAFLVNTCDRTKTAIKRLSEIDYPLYVLFFTFAGASFHVEIVKQMGLAGIIYIIARAGGKVLGTYAGTRLMRISVPNGLYLGLGLMPQAGLAIGLSSWAAREVPQIGVPILSTILATTVVFEITGPIMTRMSLMWGGEVKIIKMLSLPTVGQIKTDILSFRHRIARLLGKNPFYPAAQNRGPLLVKHLMRYHIDTIPQDVPLDKVVKIMQNTRHTILPVIGEGKRYVGLLSLSYIRDLYFDRSLTKLIIAKDVAEYVEPLTPDHELGYALERLEALGLPYLPVVEKGKDKKFIGVIHRRDICLFELEKE